MEFEHGGIAIAPVLTAFLQVLKINGYVKKETIPLISILLGLMVGVFVFSDGDIATGVIRGLYIGLTPMGLYEGMDSLNKD